MGINVNKIGASSVHVERQLAGELRRILSRADWLHGWTVELPKHGSADAGWDIVASGPVAGGKRASVLVECKAQFSPSQFASLAGRADGARRGEIAVRALAMPNVSPRLAALCEESGWSWFDLAGNCHLEVPGALLIDRTGRAPVRMERRAGVRLRSEESAAVVRALLAPENAGRRWTQRELVAHFDAVTPPVVAPSLALVNKVVQYLRSEAFLEELPSRGFRVRDAEGLLRLWSSEYRFERSARRRYFTLLAGRALQERLRGLGEQWGGGLAFAAFSAAELQAPHVRQPRTWLYVAAEHEEAFREAIEAKEVDSGENVVVFVPEDEGVFYRADAAANRLDCTNAVQTYVDLFHAGGRGQEAAEALLTQRLRLAWKGGGHAH